MLYYQFPNFLKLNKLQTVLEYAEEKGLKIKKTSILTYELEDSNGDIIELYGTEFNAVIRNTSEAAACTIALHKDKTFSTLDLHNINHPKYETIRHYGDLVETMNAIDRIIKFSNDCGYPVVLKPSMGSLRRGVRIVYSDNELVDNLIDLLSGFKQAINIEQFIPGKEYRVIVFNNSVRFALLKTYPGQILEEGEQYDVSKADLTDDQKEFCIKTANAIGLTYCGLDIREDENANFHVIEINSAPGNVHIEELFGAEELAKLFRDQIDMCCRKFKMVS